LGAVFADSLHNYSVVLFPGSSQTGRTGGTFDNNGNFHLVWQDRNMTSGHFNLHYARIAPDLSKTQDFNLTQQFGLVAGGFPAIAASANGMLYIAEEEDNYNVGVIQSSDGGNTWSNNIVLGNAGNPGISAPRITFDTANNPHVVFIAQSTSGGPSDVFASDRNSSGVWSTAVQIDNLGTGGGRAFYPYIASAPNGDVFAAWQEDTVGAFGTGAVSIAHWNHNSGKWQPELQNISQSGSGTTSNVTPSIVVDNTGTVWVAWRSGSGTTVGAQFTTSTNNGVTYGSPGQVLPQQYARAGNTPTSLAFGNGNIYFAGQYDSGSGAFSVILTYTSIGNNPPPTTTPSGTTTTATTTVPTTTPTPVCQPLISQVVALPSYEPASFLLRWSGNGGNNTLAYTVQYWDMTASSTANWQNLVTTVVGTAANFTNGVNGHIYGFRSQATDGCSVEAAHPNPDSMTVIDSTPPVGQPVISSSNGSMIVRLNLANNVTDNGGSGTATVQLSNDPGFGSFYETPYTDTLTAISWNLDAPQYGGNYTPGQKAVYIRYKDNVGNVPITPYNFSVNVTQDISSLTNFQYQAEGDTTGGNQEFLNFFNPTANDATVLATYTNADGTVNQSAYGITALGHLSINVANDVQTVHSTSIASDVAIVGETSSYRGSGLDAVTNASALGTTWYFPEGSTVNGRTTSFALYNPNSSSATVQIAFKDTNGNTISTSGTTTVPANSRVSVTDTPANAVFATTITVSNGVGIVAGRQLGWPTGGFALSTGLSSGSASWYFGYSDNHNGSGTYFNVLNPASSPVTLTFNVLSADGSSSRSSSYVLAANARANFPISTLASGAFGLINRRLTASTIVSLQATSSVVAEEIQTANGGLGAAVVQGTPSLATHWTLPGTINNDPTAVNQSDTVIVANFNSVNAYLTLTAVDDSGNSVCTTCSPITIAPHSSTTVSLNRLQGAQNQKLVVTADTPNPSYRWRYYHTASDTNTTARTITVTGVVVEHIQQYNNDQSLVLGQADPASVTAIK
jgi:hypothetical protein